MSHLLCLIRTAKISIWLSGVAITVILSIVAYAGLIIYTRFRNLAKLVYILWLKCVGWQFFSFLESPATNRYLHCDPITSGLVSTKDQLLPLFVIDILGHIPGSVRYIRFLFLEENRCGFSKLLFSRFSRLLCCWSVLRGTFHCVGRLIVFAHCQLIRNEQ